VGGIVHAVNPIVGRAGVVGFETEDGFGDFGGVEIDRHIAYAFTLAEERKSLEELGVALGGISGAEALGRASSSPKPTLCLTSCDES
jgi:hypothetical protein